MSTLILRPNGAGDLTELMKSGTGGANWDRVDEEVANDDTDYVYNLDEVEDYGDLYALPNHTTESGTINSVKVYVRRRALVGTAPNVKPCLKTGGTIYYGSVTGPTTTYSTVSTIWATNPNGGGAWTWIDIDALQIGCHFTSESSGNGSRCTQVYVEIDYSVLDIVSDTFQLIWKARKAISDTSQCVWNVRKAVSDTSQTIWKVRKAISDTVQTIWRVLIVVPGSTSQFIWNTRKAISDTGQLVWNVYTFVSDTVQAVWNVGALAAKTTQLVYNVRAVLNDTMQAVWNVKVTVSDTFQLVWNTWSTYVAKARQLVWNVREAVPDQAQMVWRVLTIVPGSTLQVIWNVKIFISDTVQVIWNTRKAISDTVQTIWRVLIVVPGGTSQFIWNVRKTVSDTSQIIWNVRKAISDVSQLVWNVRHTLSDTVQLIWKLGGFIGRAIQLVWNVYCLGTRYVPPSAYRVEVHDGTGALITILDKASKISLEESVNVPAILTFSNPSDDSKLSFITRARELWIRDIKTGIVIWKTKLLRREDVRD